MPAVAAHRGPGHRASAPAMMGGVGAPAHRCGNLCSAVHRSAHTSFTEAEYPVLVVS